MVLNTAMTWVLLRGLVREARHWGEFPSALARQFPQASVLCVDVPGNGLLNDAVSPCDIQGMVQAVRQQLHARGAKPPYAVLAISMGAMVAVQWAHSYPSEVRCQVVINTSMRPFNPFYQRLRVRSMATLLRLAVTAASPQAWEASILRLTTRSLLPGARAHILERWVALRGTHPVSGRNALRQLWAAARYRAPQSRPQVPSLLLASENDALASVACSQAIAATWSLPLCVNPHAGHDLPLDEPSWVLLQIQDWLESSVS